MTMRASDDAFQRALSEAFAGVGTAVRELASGSMVMAADSPAASEAAAFAQAYPAFDDHYQPPAGLLGVLVGVRLFAVADYLQGIATLTDPSAPSTGGFAAAAAGRAALEALAYTYWLVEPGVPWEQRVARIANEHLHDQRARHRIVQHARADGVEPLIEPDAVIEMFEIYGVGYELGSPDATTGIQLPNIVGGKRSPAADILAPLMPSEDSQYAGSVLYYLLSDVAHASIQGLAGGSSFTVSPDGRWQLALEPGAMLRRVVGVLWAVPAPIRAALQYYGADETTFAAAFHSATASLHE